MKENYQKLWVIACTSLIIAVCTFAFLPKTIPMHFSGGIADEYMNKLWIFLFPLLEFLLILIGRIKPFQYWCMNCKTIVKTEKQYYAILFCVIVLMAILEVIIIILSLFTSFLSAF